MRAPTLISLLALAALSLVLSACGEQQRTIAGPSTVASGSETATLGESNAALVGSWEFQEVFVEFLDEEGVPFTERELVYPDREVPVRYLDGRGTYDVRFQGSVDFRADGTLTSARHIYINGALEEDAVADGEWVLSGPADNPTGAVTMSILNNFHVQAFVELEASGDVATLTWNREDPMFLDRSCVIHIKAKRVAE